MSFAGWIFMIVSWLVITWLCIFSFGRIFRLQRDHLVAPLEIDTEPQETETESNESSQENKGAS